LSRLSNADRGRHVARILTGSWRPRPPASAVSETELSQALTPLLRSGAAPLAWWVLKHSDLRQSQPARVAHDTYALSAIQAVLREEALVELVRRLRSAGLDPILGKGWAAAALYPEPGLRTSGDFDLYARREEAARVSAALAGAADVDVHRGMSQLDDRPEAEVYARSETRPIRDLQLRVFSPEDHLRLLCLHLLGHGGWRPPWLCDVAAALEGRPAGFDWDYFLSGDPQRSDGAICTLVLAHELLDASLDGVPERISKRRLPRWLVPVVLAQWGDLEFEAHGLRLPLAESLGHPRALLRALALRWPNAVEATMGVRAPFNNLPRFPVRIAESIRRSARFALRRRTLRKEAL
jgi:hypothetical protein